MAKDPYKYFRIEAQELLEGLGQGIIELEKRGHSKEVVSRLLRHAHTLKGAARVVGQIQVSEVAHQIEELLEPFREKSGEVSKDQISELLKAVDRCSESLKPVLAMPSQPEQTKSAPPKPSPSEVEEAYSSVRIEIEDVDSLLYGLAETGSQLGELHRETAMLEKSADTAKRLVKQLINFSENISNGQQVEKSNELQVAAEELRNELKQAFQTFRAGLERTHRDVNVMRDGVAELRLLSADSIFPIMERTARDAATLLKKRVHFESTGGEHRLDAHVLLALRDALAHTIRNAVAHGIETESARSAAGKPAEGHVHLRVSKLGRRISFEVTDDGGGINIIAIRNALIAKGVITRDDAQSLGLQEAMKLLVEGGVSTAAEVTEIMGRGIGLDVVRSTLSRLKGDIKVQSEPGKGTTIQIIVPVSMESMDVLAVAAGESSLLIPFDSVSQTVRVANKDLTRSATGAMLVLEGQALPFLPLRQLLNTRRVTGATPTAWTTLVIQARGTQAAIGVDRIHGVRNVVVRPLPLFAGTPPLVAGATLDGEGNPEIVLDPAALIAAVRSADAAVTEQEVLPERPLLVIDDSLTSRMLEQSVLETAGFQVDLAVSGEDALEKARKKQYALFVVDVEMPGMSGFELLEQFQVDPALQSIPAILVTSRASVADRQRGQQAGARAHIAKNQFAEGELLRTIRGILGEGQS